MDYDKSYCIISWRNSSGQLYQIAYYDLEIMKSIPLGEELKKLELSSHVKPQIAVGSKDLGYYAIIQEFELYVVYVENGYWRKLSSKSKKSFTVVKCHPEEEMILTGKSNGEILLWRNLRSYSHTKVSIFFYI